MSWKVHMTVAAVRCSLCCGAEDSAPVWVVGTFSREDQVQTLPSGL